jgi:hypothetical protein
MSVYAHFRRFSILALCLAAPAVALAQTATSLYFPRLVTSDGSGGATDDSEYTGFAIANLDTATATLTFTAYDASGALITGPGVTNPATRTLAGGQQLPVVDVQIFGAGLATLKPVGWVRVDSTVLRIVGFFLVFNGSLTTLDGADVGSETLAGIVFPEIEDAGFTQIHIANPQTKATTVTLDLYSSDGTIRATAAERVVNPNGAIVATVAELFPSVTPAPSDYVRVSSTRGVAAFQYFGKKGSCVAGLNGQNTVTSGSSLYSPQYAVQPGVWRSTVSIVNVDNTPGNVSIELFGDDGAQIGATRTFPVPARGKIHLTDQTLFGTSSGLLQGYLAVASDGPRLAGSIVFGDPDGTAFASALPLVAPRRDQVVFGQVASNATYFTGVAILNAGTSAASTVIEVLDDKGALVAKRTETLQAGQRRSKLLTEIFSELQGQNRASGYIRVTPDSDVASFALFGTNNLSVLSAVPAQVVPILYDGTWSGTTGEGRTVSFTIRNNLVMKFSLQFGFTIPGGSCVTTLTQEPAPGDSITWVRFNNALSFSFRPPGLSTGISGTFTSPTEFSGSYGTVTMTNFVCGTATIDGTMAGSTITLHKE